MSSDENNGNQVGARFLKSPCGVVRIVQLVSLGIGLACTLMTSMHMPGQAMGFYNIVAGCGMVYSALSILLRATEVYTPETGNLGCAMAFEMVFCWVFVGVTTAASAWMVQFGSGRSAKLVVASACGFVAAFTYFLDFFCLVQARRIVRTREREYHDYAREQQNKQLRGNQLDITKESVIF